MSRPGPGGCATTPRPGYWLQRCRFRRSRLCWGTPARNRRTCTYRRPGASARLRTPGCRERAVMSSHGFTSAFAPDLEAYLAFKADMGFYGTSRIWYLKRLDAYCCEHNRTVFDRDTVEEWVSVQLQRSGRYRSWMSYIRDRPVAEHARSHRCLRTLRTVEGPDRRPSPVLVGQTGDRVVLRRCNTTAGAIPVAMAGGRVLHADAFVRAADRRDPRPADRAGRFECRAYRHRLVQRQSQSQTAVDRSRHRDPQCVRSDLARPFRLATHVFRLCHR